MTELSPRELMARMITGTWIAQAVYVVAKLGVADRLAESPRTADELAAATGMNGRALYRILRALASVGVFAERPDGRFELTPLAETLRDDVPGSRRAMAIMMGEEHHRCYGDLLESVRTGETAFERIYGQPIFAYLAEHPEQARTFDAAMTAIHGPETEAVLDAYDLSGFNLVADIGGGNGTTLVGTLKRHPNLKGLLFDMPGVVERARTGIGAAGLADRCRTVAGDFFQSVPEGADAYMLRHIIHDWDDEKSIAILRNVRKAIGANGKLLIVESVIPPGNGPSFGKLLDLTMLLIPGGLERTEEEFARLFESAGFRLTRVVPTTAEVCVIEGSPV